GGAERHADPFLGVSWEGEEELLFLPVPDVDSPVTSRREEPAVRTERHAVRRPTVVIGGVTRPGEQRVAGRQVPDLHPPVRSQTSTFRSAPTEARCLPPGWTTTL